MINRWGLIGEILLAVLTLTCLQAEANPFSSDSGPPGILLPSSGQTKEAEELTLPAAVDLALRQNPLIRATASGREIVDAQLKEAQAGRFPLLLFSETYAFSNNPVFVFGSLLEQGRFELQNFNINSLNHPDPLNNFRTAITLRLPLFDQLETTTRIAQARIGQEQADMQKELVKQQVRLEVIRSYFGVLVAQSKKEVAEEAVKMAEADARRIRDLFETGLVVQSDLLAAEVQVAEFRQQEVQAAGELATAHAFLNTTLGFPVQTPQKVSGQLVGKNFAAPEPEELIRLALLHRPDYGRASFAVHSTEKRARGAWGQYLPRVDFFTTYGASTYNLINGGTDYAVGASLTYNLFDLGRGAKLDQARAAQTLATVEQEHMANQIRLEVIRAYQQYVSARGRLAFAAQAVNQAEEALRIVQERYREGLTIITEVLRAQTTLVRARMNLLAARYDTYVGYAHVLMASGRLTDVQPFVS